MNRREPVDSTRGPWRGLHAALTCALLSAPFFVVQLFSSGSGGEGSLPVSIRAASPADYGQDAQTFVIPPIDENILDQIIADGSAAHTVQEPIATLQSDLSSPVPTMTVNVPPVTPTPTLLLQTPPNTLQPTLPLPTVIMIPSSVPTNLPLPTVPPILPTILPTIPPILPTVTPLLPTTISSLPTIPPLLPEFSDFESKVGLVHGFLLWPIGRYAPL